MGGRTVRKGPLQFEYFIQLQRGVRERRIWLNDVSGGHMGHGRQSRMQQAYGKCGATEFGETSTWP